MRFRKDVPDSHTGLRVIEVDHQADLQPRPADWSPR